MNLIVDLLCNKYCFSLYLALSKGKPSCWEDSLLLGILQRIVYGTDFLSYAIFFTCSFSCQNLQHLFASEQREEIIKSAIEHAGNFIGISLRIRKESLEFEQYLNLRFGKYSNDESVTSLAEFVVQKITPRHLVRVSKLNLLGSS